MPAHTVFVSHAHADNEVCDRYVATLRGRGLDVWYDRTNMQAGHSLSADIEAELRRRTAFVVLATPASLASQWVRSEIAAFRSLAAHDPTRIFLPLRAAECDMPLLWVDILWIDAVSLGFDAAVDAMAVALGASAAPTSQPTDSGDEMAAMGTALINQEKYAEAIPFLERAAQLDPGDFITWTNLGGVYNNTGRYGDGLTACQRALALDDQQPIPWHNKGVALFGMERYEEALVAYDRALALDLDDADTCNAKGNTLYKLERYEEALVVLDKALALDPTDASIWTSKGKVLIDQYDRARFEGTLGRKNYAKPIPFLEQATQLDPRNADAWYHLGRAYRLFDRSDDALTAFDRALALDENRTDAWNDKANIFFNSGRYEDSVEAFEEALDIDPENTYALSCMAQALRNLGRVDEAEVAAQRLKKLGWPSWRG